MAVSSSLRLGVVASAIRLAPRLAVGIAPSPGRHRGPYSPSDIVFRVYEAGEIGHPISPFNMARRRPSILSAFECIQNSRYHLADLRSDLGVAGCAGDFGRGFGEE